jgi:PhnB protein
MAKAKKAIPDGYHTVTPTLTFDNEGKKAIDWYKTALGAEELSRNLGPDGALMHAELRLGDSRIMLHDAMMGAKGSKAFGGSPMSLWIYVENCDSLFERAVGAGGKITMAMADQFWGDRCGSIADPFGYSWTIATHKEDLTPQEMQQRQAEFFKQFPSQSQKPK